MKFPIVWASEKKPTGEVWSKYIEPDLYELFLGLSKAEDLIFHTIFIGTSIDDPIVMAYGKENDLNVYLDYLDDVQWIRYTDDR